MMGPCPPVLLSCLRPCAVSCWLGLLYNGSKKFLITNAQGSAPYSSLQLYFIFTTLPSNLYPTLPPSPILLGTLGFNGDCTPTQLPILSPKCCCCLLTSMAATQNSDRKAAFVFVGDFNAHHREWLSSVSPTNCHGLKALDFSSEAGCEQLIHKPTHRSGNCLDLVFTDAPDVVACTVVTPIGT